MYKLFLKIATRYLLKNKLYSFINIFGLAVGTACFILIMLYVNHEESYDTFDGSENIYRAYMDYLEGDKWVAGDANSYIVTGETLKENFPEIFDYARLRYFNGIVLLKDNEIYEHNKGSLADPSFLELFDLKLRQGNAQNALTEPYSMVLTESLAKKLFGNEEPMGKSLKLHNGNSPSFTITGILKENNRQTHIKNDFLVSFSTFRAWDAFERDWEYTWNQNVYYTFLSIDPKTNARQLQQKIKDFKIEALPFERHNIEPLEDIHLYSNKPYEAEANGSILRVRFLFAIGLIIIVLSWLNYINLSTAKSIERAKETGIRKVAGAQKPQIIIQSLLESLLLNFIAIAIAIGIVIVFLPSYNAFIGKELSFGIPNFAQILPLFGLILLGAAMSGIYPAFVLSGYTPTKTLKGKVHSSSLGLNIRKALIIGQFFATIVLIVGTIMISKQIGFLKNQPTGTDLQQVVALHWQVLNSSSDSTIVQGIKTFKDKLQNLPFIEQTATANTFPGGRYEDLGSSAGITFPDGRRDDKRITYNYAVSPKYFELMGFEFAAGKPFRENSQGLGNDIVMNEKFIRFMGISDSKEAIGKTVRFWNQDWTIVGVLKDYHHFGLKTGIEPMILRYGSSSSNILAKLNQKAVIADGLGEAMVQIEDTWKEIFPQSTFKYTFLDENFEAQYKDDKAFGTAFQIFTILSILIASMGLFGLTSYTVIRRKKEIGVRKVNGATITQILSLLNKDFVKWVGLAFIIAVPVSWYAMNQWLEGFAYKTNLDWWVFALAGITALTIALLTVSWQSFRAAIVNPVESLRDE
ncbi:ABC transporter permease [Allomuricauda sp. SCSIO 65647]|uniref:ABC transporter permease n=1 Tax=Allomuricauda sp. SCSIO 65647 TaxID=2908843 RepID=UPI001F2067A9|nr:ABC transporter permease [Muricauda sp. SCSIO 65647]UJH69158.1 ABC transporter permease [Muricauda sp. SCSIO 65647]